MAFTDIQELDGRLPIQVAAAVADIKRSYQLRVARAYFTGIAYDSVGHSVLQVRRTLEKQAPARHGQITKAAEALLAAPGTQASFARFSQVNVKKLGALESVNLLPARGSIPKHLVRAIVGRRMPERERVTPQADVKRVDVCLTSLRRFETSDEPSAAEVVLGINYLDVRGKPGHYWTRRTDFAKAGFAGIQQTLSFHLGPHYPHKICLLLTLIEEDWDHAADEIQTIFDGIKDEIHRDADDLAAFLAVEADTPDYSSLLTLIFQTLTSSVYNWLMSWFKNDPLGTYRQIITIHGGGAIWSANNQPVLTMVYQFDGVDSHYEVAANLTLVAA